MYIIILNVKLVTYAETATVWSIKTGTYLLHDLKLLMCKYIELFIQGNTIINNLACFKILF